MKIFATETSFDETAAAVVEDGTKIISNVIATSAEMHRKYGGVVPEIAAREQLRCILPVTIESLLPLQSPNRTSTGNNTSIIQMTEMINKRENNLPAGQSIVNAKNASWVREIIEKNIDAVAVAVGPGLAGSLLVGVETAKTIAFVTAKPIIPVNHVLAHMYANSVETSSQQNSSRGSGWGNIRLNLQPTTYNLQPDMFPAISLVVSGGHTELYLMKSLKKLKWLGGTLDDAAGEAFDKTARLLGFGTGGGLAIQSAARACLGQPYNSAVGNTPIYNVKLPRPMTGTDNLNFSFSGLKTAVTREFTRLKAQYSDKSYPFGNDPQTPLPENIIRILALELQEAITDVLVEKTLLAARLHQAKSVLLSGGVAANQRLRDKLNSRCADGNLGLFMSPLPLCTDNAVFIACCAFFRGKARRWQSIKALPDLAVEV